ncbi:hypothetical protein HCG49_04080 [Arenibacter sp. 6A1]|uniref:hypothetical protein n=1 Tax=Arenibacter sp. 6A1 TaxID=2720391 RepID=UPI0014450711|nr:hypothetical protein [Arenibacter sp. 6A1]NKI25735.1 hypothetical protein [Arenibacter sp. 6A1]
MFVNIEKDNDLSFFSGARRGVGESYRCRFFFFFFFYPKLKQVSFGFSERNRITFGGPFLSMLQIQYRLEKDNDLSFFSGAGRSAGGKLSLPVFVLFQSSNKYRLDFLRTSGLPSVILFYQCCKFSTA